MLGADHKLINTEVRIETTNRCQARCIMSDMSYDDFIDTVNQSKNLGAKSITLFGFGEPLLDVTIIEKVAYCTENELETFITTNAGLLDIDMGNGLLKAGLSHIRFSIHALQPTEYETIHRGLKFDVMQRNVANFLATNRVKYDGACKTSVSVIPQFGESVELIRKAWEPAVDYLEIWRPHNWGGKASFREGLRQKQTCGRPFNGPVQINADGTVMVCCFDFDAQMIIGNTNDVPLYAILRGEPLFFIQEAHKERDYGTLPCAECDQLNNYTEENWPLLYSNRDPEMKIGVTSSCKKPVE